MAKHVVEKKTYPDLSEKMKRTARHYRHCGLRDCARCAKFRARFALAFVCPFGICPHGCCIHARSLTEFT
jgi:hypothetical protein